ncbi:MAG: hypothetical protein WCJ25_05570 [Candidatus Moraniibacteriota bacterium]
MEYAYDPGDDASDESERELLTSFSLFIPKNRPVKSDMMVSLRSLDGILGLKGELSASDVISFLPRGIEEVHANGMKKFLHDLDWRMHSSGIRGLSEKYACLMSYGHILPITKELVRFDEETMSRILFPEDHLGSEEEREFYVRHQDCIEKLWAKVYSYFSVHFPACESNIASVSTFFYLAQAKWLDVVELSALALMRHRAILYAKKGIFDGIVKSVRQTEAEALADAINAIRQGR